MLQPVLRSYRSAFGGLSKETWWLSFVMLVNRSGTMVVPFLTLYLTDARGFTIAKAGLVMGLFGAGAIAGGFIGGKLTDKYGFRRVQLFALTGGGIFFMLLGQMQSYSSICICTFFLSLVNESFRPANATAIAQYSAPENRTRSYSLNRLAINVGWALGGALGGILATINYHLLFWVDGITNLLAASLLFLLMPASASRHDRAHESQHMKSTSAYRDRLYLLFILFTTFFAMCFFQLFTNLPVFLRQDLHFSKVFIGLLLAMNGIIIAFIEMIMVNRLEGRRSSLSYIFVGVTLCSISFFMYNLFPGGSLLAITAMIMVTFGEMFSMPFMNSFWISRSSPSNRGQYAGLYTVSWATAQVLGPVLGSQIAQHYNFPTLWWILGTVCIMSAFGFLYMKTLSPKTYQEPIWEAGSDIIAEEVATEIQTANTKAEI
jgi:predicted MFS family arabinose efflux permease